MGVRSTFVSANTNMNAGTCDMLAPPPMSSGLLAPPSSTSGGFLAPPPTSAASVSQGQGSIALRAMRSVRSLARMGSWVQFSDAIEENSKKMGRRGTRRRRATGRWERKKGRRRRTGRPRTPKAEVTMLSNPNPRSRLRNLQIQI
jgi:serine/arginine repetitive matrix protein 2